MKNRLKSFAAITVMLCLAVLWSPLITAQAPAGTNYVTVLSIANASSTGTTVNTLTKLTGAPSTAVIAGTSDNKNGAIVGITTSGAGTTGSASIAQSGLALCVFDGATTAGHFVTVSTGTAGDCTDFGANAPTDGSQIIGRVLSTNGQAGSYNVLLYHMPGNASATAPMVGTGINCGSSATCASPTALGALKYATGTFAMSSSTTANVSGLSPAFTSATSYSCSLSNANAHAYTSGIEITSSSAFTAVSGTSNSDTWIYFCVGF